jgi:hypothetical protein
MTTSLVEKVGFAVAFLRIFLEMRNGFVYPKFVIDIFESLSIKRLRKFLWWLRIQPPNLKIFVWIHVVQTVEDESKIYEIKSLVFKGNKQPGLVSVEGFLISSVKEKLISLC